MGLKNKFPAWVVLLNGSKAKDLNKFLKLKKREKYVDKKNG
jgi:hypothetical protein